MTTPTPPHSLIVEISNVLFDYHMDMLKDPTITDLTPYIKRIRQQLGVE